jgi:hypothetical protein
VSCLDKTTITVDTILYLSLYYLVKNFLQLPNPTISCLLSALVLRHCPDEIGCLLFNAFLCLRPDRYVCVLLLDLFGACSSSSDEPFLTGLVMVNKDFPYAPCIRISNMAH